MPHFEPATPHAAEPPTHAARVSDELYVTALKASFNDYEIAILASCHTAFRLAAASTGTRPELASKAAHILRTLAKVLEAEKPLTPEIFEEPTQ